MVACSGSAVSDRRARLPGSPKRELREYVLLHQKLNRIPSARASGFKASRRAFSGVPARPPDQPGRSGRVHRAGPPPLDPVVRACRPRPCRLL